MSFESPVRPMFTMFTVHKPTFALGSPIVRSRVKIVNIGNSRMIANEKRERSYVFSLLYFVPMFTKPCEHCVNISQERVVEAPAGKWCPHEDSAL